ncbi:tRNA (5-methylaminomethyl-2-thiouridine)(34)-methyltransferase MnmD [Allomuricauda sp. SCSIO 65647]|uniref:tRNA (5-methylaminomethyl-2-thiouridine)(34)-methyltransferase MnmD n=1 Tax=Allomuricauda sp. SCSIO 65647 TaxID=2908843 RepID=UPI001F3A2837|nr:tRNA (5-methylaminomethyl-2-thiouridine)(34)-methyltransferase MnmD [Muricauda sp. SCSIO 65647]UJH66776.1 tRNA (5-methylaminomethyl-2-thiouridine)(34)-methyltransferase MnmD [Muricauda sp. SCSIO 65647]
MKRKIVQTGDGSKTIQITEWNERYHSIHGAVQEAYHVFIKHGFEHVAKQRVEILEMGFGTGLNALITFLEAQKNDREVNYCGVEAFPITMKESIELNYCDVLDASKFEKVFEQMHLSPWGTKTAVTPNFTLEKRKQDFFDVDDRETFDLVYFDAFGARVQPELWTERLFEKMFQALRTQGVLVTYSAKGSVRRAMQNVGFLVERLPGPPGKREMLRATKP